jgi:hypothetical protein
LFIFPIVVLAVFLYTRRLSSPRKAAIEVLPEKEVKTTPEKIAEVSAVPIPALRPDGLKAEYFRHEFTGRKGRIVNAYRERLKAIMQEGKEMMPQTTLREYSQSLEGKVDGETLMRLLELTRLTEMALYSQQEPDQELVERAEKLGNV